jgi:hypothetical protein
MTMQTIRNLVGNRLRKDDGLTLVEVMVATVITALVAVTLFRLTNDAANSLTGTVNQVVSTNQIVGFTRTLRSDIGSANDVFTFGETAPTSSIGTNYLCSSWRKNSVATDWTDPTSASFVRPLISMPTLWVDMTGNTAATPTFVEPSFYWVGYEIRGNTVANDYELWRVACYDTAGTANADVVSQRLMVSIPAVNFNAQAFGTIASGSSNTAVMLCSSPNDGSTPSPAATLGTDIGAPCNLAGTDTTSGSNSVYSYFQFKFPYLASSATSTPGEAGSDAINLSSSDVKYSDSLTQLLTRKIGN